MNEMQVSVESVDNFTRRLSVTVPISQLEERKKLHILELAKKTRLDGFRAGKVPPSHIEKLYGSSIWQEVIEKSLQISLSTALERETLNPVGHPHIESIKAEPGADLTYTASFEIYPQVEVPTLKGASLERLKVNITEEDIVKVLEQMRKQYAEWIDVPDKACYGDRVSFDIVFADSEEKTRRDLQWVLEEDKIPEGFSALLSSVAGDTLSVSLPKEQGNSAAIKVKKVAKAKLPELDNAFAKRLDIKEGTIEALKDQVREHMQIELDRILREKLKTQVIDKLVTIHAINELPQGALNQEFKRLEQDVFRQQKQQNNERISLSEIEKADLMKMAYRRVTLGLLFNALIEKHHLHVDESRVQQHIDKLVGAFQFDQMVRDKLYKDKNMMMNIRSLVLEEQVIDKLLEEVEYTEKLAEYSEIMNLTKKSGGMGNTDGVAV
ncbi:trigger factor [Rickettsiella endosymbiont of Xylota segnis]|uniref:trigger factor n=1 Tax=Rickettsiella endosymbiont of Xylota segnis TaxID=3066238 RepID=UPI0030CBFB2A